MQEGRICDTVTVFFLQSRRKSLKRYRHYIFDFYGTLADIRTDETQKKLWEKMARWYGRHGAAYKAKELQNAYLAFCSDEQANSPDPLFEIELRRVFARLYAEKGCRPEESLTEETAVFFRRCSTEKLELYPWTRPLLLRLRAAGAGIYLLSNAQACFTEYELKKLGIDRSFDGIVLSSDAGVRKPSPAIMERLLKTYGLKPQDCLMTGNDRTTDIAVAAAFDMDSLYLETATSRKDLRFPRAVCEMTEREAADLSSRLGF